MTKKLPTNLRGLKSNNYQLLPVREELRKNLITKLQNGEEIFPGIVGYENTVIPQLQNAILSGQDIILLGERGQAKSRIIRSLTTLFDEWTPILAHCEIPENPFSPISPQGHEIIAEEGDRAEINWMHRDERYGEKLATPDITIADLIGEVDPIKVAEGRYLSDSLTLHYGLIPHTNRGIFAINELPDLAERIQVGLLNAMEERDVQIRGHKVRLPLDVLIVATANPEDYTNRGRIITPLKDRYGSQIRTHYPQNIDHEISIMEQEGQIFSTEDFNIEIPDYMKRVIAEITRLARKSPDVNQRSGVSVRASVANYEAILANSLRRSIRLKEKNVAPRISDLPFVVPSLQGKVELETVEDGKDQQIIERLILGAVVSIFNEIFEEDELEGIIESFNSGLSVQTGESESIGSYTEIIKKVNDLEDSVHRLVGEQSSEAVKASATEFILEGLHLNKRLNKETLSSLGDSIYKA
ncbi:MAG: magnesium chelatase [Chloroflexi bacterium]|nr:magnesium chelatase [Chloroflexota bacterium]